MATNKATEEETEGVPHHMMGTTDWGVECNVHEYREEALRIVSFFFFISSEPRGLQHEWKIKTFKKARIFARPSSLLRTSCSCSNSGFLMKSFCYAQAAHFTVFVTYFYVLAYFRRKRLRVPLRRKYSYNSWCYFSAPHLCTLDAAFFEKCPPPRFFYHREHV